MHKPTEKMDWYVPAGIDAVKALSRTTYLAIADHHAAGHTAGLRTLGCEK